MSTADPIRKPITSASSTGAQGEAATSLAPAPELDIATCKAILAEGSKSFAAASRLLPARIRDPAAVFYAFCRIADDLVDYSESPHDAVQTLHERLDRIYARQPDADPVDRALSRVVAEYELPRPLFDALIDGFAWDAQERVYEDFSSVVAYSARVASAVGVVMTLLMGPRDSVTLARACDLGVAMQLTNIARDVAEDAQRGRSYLPREWFVEAGLDPEAFLADPSSSAELEGIVRRLLEQADLLYRRADAGIGRLPRDSRAAIRAARLIYADIARALSRQGYDPLVGRAYVSKARKLWLLLRALLRPTPASVDAGLEHEPALPEVQFLLDAVAAIGDSDDLRPDDAS
jgi:phytoene synthase